MQWHVWLHSIIPHYLINGSKIFEKKKLNITCVLFEHNTCVLFEHNLCVLFEHNMCVLLENNMCFI